MSEEKEPVKTKREIWEAGIRAKNPDVELADDEALYEAAMRGYDTEHEYRKSNEEGNKKMYELLTKNPDVAMFMSSLVTDGNVGKAMSYLADALLLEEGTPEYAEYQKGIEERKKKEAEQEAALAEYEQNLKDSAEELKAFADENGMSEEDAVEFVRKITDVINEKLFAGKIDKEFLNLFFRAFNYDKDMATAEEAGRIDGRNERIDQKNKRLKKGDGLPQVQPSATTSADEFGGVENDTLKTLRGMSDRSARNRELFG